MKITTFKKFSKELTQSKIVESQDMASKKLMKATEAYHESQLKLQELQRQFIGIQKENKTEREELKKAIIAQNKIVKQTEATFQKYLGDEDITDLEI